MRSAFPHVISLLPTDFGHCHQDHECRVSIHQVFHCILQLLVCHVVLLLDVCPCREIQQQGGDDDALKNEEGSQSRSHAGVSLSVCGHIHRPRSFWLMRVTVLVSADHVFTAMVWILLTHWKKNYLMDDGPSIQSTHTVTVTL
jgi:hypothetical protein